MTKSGDHDQILQAVFRFKNKRPSDTQTEAFCVRLRGELGATVGAIVDGEVAETTEGDAHELNTPPYLDPLHDDRTIPLDAFSSLDVKHIRAAWMQLRQRENPHVGSVWTVEWFPQYAAVLQAERMGVDSVMLRVLALDKWEWTRHFLPSGDTVDSATPSKSVLLSCARVATSSLQDFRVELKDAIATAKLRVGISRSAARAPSGSESMGHQKTPQFLVAAVRTAIDVVNKSTKKHLPRGGMTDVGLHTGGAARDTCWPLLFAAFRQGLPRSSIVADKVLLKFLGGLLDHELSELEKTAQNTEKTPEAFWARADMCYEMLQGIVSRVVLLTDAGYRGEGLLKACRWWRGRLDKCVEAWNQARGSLFCLPSRMAGIPREFPHLSEPQQTPFDEIAKTLVYEKGGDCEQAAVGYELTPIDEVSELALLKFVATVKNHEHAKALLGLRAMEALLYKRAELLAEMSAYEGNEPEPEALQKIVTWYGEHVKLKEIHGDDVTRVQAQSTYTLLAWIAFCVAHRHCSKEYGAMKNHKIVLDWKRLDILVLRERTARVALLRVCQYIHDWNLKATDAPLFDLSMPHGTMALARQMSQELECYHSAYRGIQTRWQQICEAKWNMIASRKERLQVVRQEINGTLAAVAIKREELAREESALRKALDAWREQRDHQCRLGQTYNPGRKPKLWNRVTTQYQSEINRLSNIISQKRNKENRLKQMPEFLVSALPADVYDALQVLWLLSPPKNIDVLAGLCFEAQSSLYPGKFSRLISASGPSTISWRQHFETHVDWSIGESSQHVLPYPVMLEVPSTFGSRTIDDVSSLDSFVTRNSWFPGSIDTTFLWRSGSEWKNPFLGTEATSREAFTPEVPSGSGFDWKWAIAHPGCSTDLRGNLTYAQWGEATATTEGDHGTLEFTCRGSLRAYPTQQLRRIFASVETDSLTWSDATVSAIVRQSLYQVGEIVANPTGRLYLAWHQDLEDPVRAADFNCVLDKLVQTLEHSPRRWKCLPLLSELAGFLLQYADACTTLALTLARMAVRWAGDIRKEWQRDGTSSDEKSELRTRECTLYGYALLCFDHHIFFSSTDTSRDVPELCEFLVLFHNATLFTGEASTGFIRPLLSRVERMMAIQMA